MLFYENHQIVYTVYFVSWTGTHIYQTNSFPFNAYDIMYDTREVLLLEKLWTKRWVLLFLRNEWPRNRKKQCITVFVHVEKCCFPLFIFWGKFHDKMLIPVTLLVFKGIVHLNIIFSYMKDKKICNLNHPVY